MNAALELLFMPSKDYKTRVVQASLPSATAIPTAVESIEHTEHIEAPPARNTHGLHPDICTDNLQN